MPQGKSNCSKGQSPYYSAKLEYCSTLILQYQRTALDIIFQVSLELQDLEIFFLFFIQKGKNLASLKRAPRALRYSVEIKKICKWGPIVNMRFLKSNRIPPRPRRNQTVRKGNQLITLQNCSTAVLQYCSTAKLQQT